MRNCCFFLAVMLVLACSSEAPTATTDTATPPADPAPPAAAPSGNDFAPKTSRDGGAASGPTISAPGAAFTLPGNWVSEPPSSSMRLAQARIPGAGGDAELTVFYFGAGGGGGVESNLERWIGQVDASAEPTRDTFTRDAFRATWVDVEGTLKPSTMGTGPTTPQPGSRLLGAVVEGPQGPWFFKATGPAETLAAEREAFIGLLKSVRSNG